TYYFLIRAVDAAGNVDSNLNIKSIAVPASGPIGKVLGDACRDGTECQSTFCADGVCCDGACTGDCSFCANGGSEGECQPAKAGTNPRLACGDAGQGTQLLCGDDGTCSQCQALANDEICNNGTDDNGDGLIDAQDPACAVCLGP